MPYSLEVNDHYGFFIYNMSPREYAQTLIRQFDRLAAAFGQMIFDDGGNNRRLLAQINCARRHDARRIHHVGVAGNPCERFFYAFEIPDRQIELGAYSAIGPAGPCGELGGTDAGGGQ